MRLSLIIPCFNEEEVLNLFMDRTAPVIETIREKHGIDTEYIFINDGSTDGTLAILKQLHAENPSVHYISFSRNFGKESAIYAGLKNARGDYAVTMDADMQDPPALLPEMYKAVREESYDSAATRRVTRHGEPVIRSFFARRFYRLINRMSSADIVDGARDYRIMTRRMVDAIVEMQEYNRFTKGIYGWIGFNTKWIAFENVERVAGETKWSFWKLFGYAMEGIIGFSTIPLSMATWFGILMSMVSFLGILFIIIKKIVFGDPTSGWSSMVCIILLVAGIQLFCMGIIGQYLAKTYLETKRRPIYIAKSTSEDDAERENG